MDKKSIRKDYFNFLRNPTYEKKIEVTPSRKLVILFKVFVLTYLGIFIVTIPETILVHFEVFKPVEMKSIKIYDSIVQQSSYKPYFLLLSVIIYPILEEISFRLPLTNFNVRNFKISFSVLSGLLISFLLVDILWWPSTNITFFLLGIFYILVISCIVFILLNYKRDAFVNLKIRWNQKPNIIFYSNATLFAFMHIFNLDLDIYDVIFLPLILLPFFIFGINFGYVRIRLGLKYSILLHMVINGLVLGLRELA
ncbi:CPBP family glutamic-type intramembrane protease [Zobellia alginiliquefaciens]|uniref:CPBP family glutamic-type intramembrane protease n=1 Tax=Zobellia alginiliquefaciens TaxID=3032586 RepID=UPI0023E41E15|nr:CPBP family glutamic-type intramembrane protease [Zobellia alginiliquefaciens]